MLIMVMNPKPPYLCSCINIARHIINLIVKEALDSLKYLIETFRTVIFLKTLLSKELLHIKVLHCYYY
jgi:hypothetical protein